MHMCHCESLYVDSTYSRYQKYLNTLGKPESSKGYKNLTISSILMLIFSVVPIND